MEKIYAGLLAAVTLLFASCTTTDPVTPVIDPPMNQTNPMYGKWNLTGMTATTKNTKSHEVYGVTESLVFRADYSTTEVRGGEFTIDSSRFNCFDFSYLADTTFTRETYANNTLTSTASMKFEINVGFGDLKSPYRLTGKDSIYFEKGIFPPRDGGPRLLRPWESSRGTWTINHDTLILDLAYYGTIQEDSLYVRVTEGTQLLKFVRK